MEYALLKYIHTLTLNVLFAFYLAIGISNKDGSWQVWVLTRFIKDQPTFFLIKDLKTYRIISSNVLLIDQKLPIN